jgi:probable rRNA maturation factor
MAGMKKHLLEVEIQSTIKFSPKESRQLDQWLDWASRVADKLISEKLIPLKGAQLSTIRISMLICGDTRIRKLNHEFRGKDRVTDVLSFPSAEGLRKGKLKNYLEEGELFLGDLAICAPQARRQAERFEIGFWDEFIHLFFHGFLHLLGFDHEVSDKEEREMQKWEDRALELFSLEKKKGSRSSL